MSLTKKIGAAAGVAAPILAFTSILSSIATYPAFSWTNNALSDLGIISGITGPLFNFGLCVTGVLGLVFAILGLYVYFDKGWVGKLGSTFFAAATISLILIGIFNEHFSPTHYIVSVGFFSLAPIALFILTFAFWLDHNRKMSAFTIVVGLAAAIPWILQLTINYVPKVAIPEAISALFLAVWVIVFAAKTLKPN